MAKIAVADDSNFMRQLLVGILNKAGYTDIIEAKDGVEALDICQNEKPDLLLLDIIMPNMDGLEVLNKIDTSQKVVVVTAVGQEKAIEEAKSLGVLGYIIKPFESKKIIEEVKKALGES